MMKNIVQEAVSKRRRFVFSIAVSLLGAAAVAPLSAQSVIFTNFGTGQTYDPTNGLFVGNDPFVVGNLAEGDTFTPSATYTLGDLQLALSCFASCSDPFIVALTTDSGSDSPGSVIESFTFTGMLGSSGNLNPPIVLDSVLFPTLTAGTQYWVTVADPSNTETIVWNNNPGDGVTGDLSDQAISTDGGTTWFSPSGQTDSAYQVDSKPPVSNVRNPALSPCWPFAHSDLQAYSSLKSGGLSGNRPTPANS
jgi:hypothetical protein